MVVFLLTGLGLLALSSASFSMSDKLLTRQFIWLIISVISAMIFAFIPLELLHRLRNPVTYVMFVALILVLIPPIGHVVNGSRRWIKIGSIGIQVSEFAKIAIIIWLSAYISKHIHLIDNLLYGFGYPMIITCIFSTLILLEPDYGTAFLFISVAITLLFLSGAKIVYLLYTVIFGGIIFSILIWLNPVRLKRIMSFLDIEGNKSDGSYQLWQGMLSFAAGGIFGEGIGLGRQKISYLPEAHTDFILAVIGEEMGFILTGFIMFLFFLFAISCLLILRQQSSLYPRLLGYGATLMITYQAIMNMCVVTGCMPTKGISLPFISYGGSNLLLLYSLVGIIFNCMRYDKPILEDTSTQ
ncbi:MAG: putative lipid II flippase FtsW [Puniceicoccales bacterium]|nr:putative lipid II flippase FtsW [Puniceicoccales bacterium]